MSCIPLVRIWILLSALAGVAGWTLSALGQLNRGGYAVVAVMGLAGLFLTRRVWWNGATGCSWGRIKTRFARPLPLGLAVLAALVFLGGVLYAPGNFDALTYRLPRVMHWLAQERWHWIHTATYRMNNRSCGFEWLMTPVLLATGSTRGLFLINFIPFLLLPGLVFSVFTRLGVNGRVAWQWMWLLPTGYGFLLQAASLGNDAFAAIYALAAVDFALRAAVSRRVSDVWFSLLAAALLTGAKSGNLPLLLPWFLVFMPVLPRLLVRPAGSLAVMGVALLVSFLPTAVLNCHFIAGDWSGLSLESRDIAMRSPVMGMLGNTVALLLANFTPTLFPLAGWWNNSLPALCPGLFKLLQPYFEGNFYKLGEIPTEEWSGLGFGISCLLAISLLAARFRRFQTQGGIPWPRRMVLASPYVSLAFFFAKSGMMTVARLVSAYYPLLLPALLCGLAPSLVRHHWWRRATLVAMLLACLAVILTPARPLWPVQTLLSRLAAVRPNHPLTRRVTEVYQVYARRPDALAPARAALPDDCTVVGFAGDVNDPEISLWHPVGRRRVEDVVDGDSTAQMRARGIQYVVVGELFLSLHHQTIETWLQAQDATLVSSFRATLIMNDPHFWYVVRLNPPAAAVQGVQLNR